MFSRDSEVFDACTPAFSNVPAVDQPFPPADASRQTASV